MSNIDINWVGVNGETAPTNSELIGAVDPTGNLAPLKVDSGNNLLVALAASGTVPVSVSGPVSIDGSVYVHVSDGEVRALGATSSTSAGPYGIGTPIDYEISIAEGDNQEPFAALGVTFYADPAHSGACTAGKFVIEGQILSPSLGFPWVKLIGQLPDGATASEFSVVDASPAIIRFDVSTLTYLRLRFTEAIAGTGTRNFTIGFRRSTFQLK